MIVTLKRINSTTTQGSYFFKRHHESNHRDKWRCKYSAQGKKVLGDKFLTLLIVTRSRAFKDYKLDKIHKPAKSTMLRHHSRNHVEKKANAVCTAPHM